MISKSQLYIELYWLKLCLGDGWYHCKYTMLSNRFCCCNMLWSKVLLPHGPSPCYWLGTGNWHMAYMLSQHRCSSDLAPLPCVNMGAYHALSYCSGEALAIGPGTKAKPYYAVQNLYNVSRWGLIMLCHAILVRYWQ